MKIIIDHKIPFIRGVFEPHAQVEYIPGGTISRDHLNDSDGLLIRTRTHCNEALLSGTPVKFIGTATIGFDHIDTGYCDRSGIRWTSAPGCNSGSVMQYVAAAIAQLALKHNLEPQRMTLGVIGAGNVGKKVARLGQTLGMNVLVNDPPRERAEGPVGFVTLDRLLNEADIVTLHVPLNRTGPDKTWGLADRGFLARMKSGAWLFNTSRGEVISEPDLLEHLQSARRGPGLVIDVWNNEPTINRSLLDAAEIATPHIAGYSQDGKINGTRMIVSEAARFFGLPDIVIPELPDAGLLSPVSGIDGPQSVWNAILASYPINDDDRRLRQSPETFEEQRNNYPVRREFFAHTLLKPADEITARQLTQLGFQLQ